MESLPFGNSSFDAGVSQFGLEYSDVPSAAAELHRILSPGASVACLLHHADSPIAAQSRRRNQALSALASAEVERLVLDGSRTELLAVLSRIGTEYPDQDVVREFSAGLANLVTRLPRERQALWTDICQKVAGERLILDSLARAAVPDIRAFLEAFAGRFVFETADALTDRNGAPLAWGIKGVRR